MALFQEKYGIPAEEVENLYSRYRKNHLEEGFGSFDNFLKFASESNYEPFWHLRRYDPNLPHSPDNSFFYCRTANGVPPKKSGPKLLNIVSPYCVGCKQKCPQRTGGCLGWRMYFIRNWNQNICIRKPAVQETPPKPAKKEYFRYEHPDIIRGGRK